MEKPKLTADQVISASNEARRFGEVRKNAKNIRQFISENNRIDSVVQSYEDYEKIFMELEALRESNWKLTLSNRIQNADLDSAVRFSLEEVMRASEYEKFRENDPNSIKDEDLFE